MPRGRDNGVGIAKTDQEETIGKEKAKGTKEVKNSKGQAPLPEDQEEGTTRMVAIVGGRGHQGVKIGPL